MSVIDKVTVGGTTYDLQDTKAQNDCAELKSAIAPYEDAVIAVRNIAPVVTQGFRANAAAAGAGIALVSGSNYGYVCIPVKGGAKYALNMDVSANFSWWAYKSSAVNGTAISKVTADSNHIITSPDNADLLYITISGGTADTGLVVIEQDAPIYGATITDYPRGEVFAVDIPLLRDSGETDEKIIAAQDNAIAYTNQMLTAPDELINAQDITDDYYVKASDGTIAGNSSFCVTDYVSVLPGVLYRVQGGANGSQVAFYDENKAFITGSGLVINRNQNIKTPDGTRYLRWCTTKANKADISLKLSGTYYINVNEGILSGLMDAYEKGVAYVEVGPGDYNIINEYTAKFGATYFENYTANYNGLVNGAWDRGLWLDNIKITFNPAAKVICKYNPSGDPNANVRGYFSPFAVGVNVEIVGLVLDSENCRYGIHPDFNGSTFQRTFFKMSRCDVKHFKSSWSQAIGAGLGIHSDWVFEDCIFRSDAGKIVVRIHNNSGASAQSTITFKNCYVDGTGWIQVNAYATSPLITRVIASGCSWITPIVIGKETDDSANNVELYAFANEQRS